MDPMWLIVLRVTERIVIYAGAIFTIYLGFALYKRGISKGRGDLQANTQLGQIILSGTGPGLFFMAFGAIILLVGLFTGGGKVGFGKLQEKGSKIPDYQMWEGQAEAYDMPTDCFDEWQKESKKEWDD